MSYIRSILIFGLTTCIFACHRTPHYPQTMLRAEELLDTAPDSAYALLLHLDDSISTVDKATRMYYYLLTVKAKDKCYIPHTSDSLMKEVVEYYDKRGTVMQRMEAYYYLGSTYRDMQDAPRALDYFQKAADATADSTEYQILMRIYSEMGILYLYQKVYEEALPVLKKSYHYCALAKDSMALPYVLRNLGRAFTAQKEVDSTLYYYETAYQAAKRINNAKRMGAIQGEMAGNFIQLGQYTKAHEALMQSSAELYKRKNIAPFFLIQGEYYKSVGQLDSAAFYYRKALAIGNATVKEGGYWGLYQIARMNSHDKEALEYVEQFLAYQDSVQKITDTEAVRRLQMLYNYHNIVREKDHFAIEYQRSKLLVYRLLIFGVLLLAICVGAFFYVRRKKEHQLMQERKLRFFEEERYKESRKQIELNNAEITLLKDQLESANDHNEPGKESLALKKYSLEEKNKNIEIICIKRESLIESFHRSEIYMFIIENSKNPDFRLSDKHWHELREAMDATYDNFTGRLYFLYPNITEIELHVCYLIKMSVSAVDIAHCVVRHKNSISSIRKRLYKKIHGVAGTAKELDTFISDF